MKKSRFDFCGVRGIRVLGVVCAVYLILFTIELPRSRIREELRPSIEKVSLPSSNYKENEIRNAPERPFKESLLVMKIPERPFKDSLPVMEVSERSFKEPLPVMEGPERPFKESLPVMEGPVDVKERRRELTELEKAAVEAWDLGKKAWEEMEAKTVEEVQVEESKLESEACPGYISMREKFSKTAAKMMMRLPCGLRVGSSITLVGRPRQAHEEKNPRVSKEEDSTVMVSQFMLELQGLNAVDGEDPPRILHFNPRLKGDWSGKPVLELNTCYRMQWASSQRCSGWGSKEEEETVDGLPKCEKWITNDVEDSKQTKTTSWLNRLLWGEKKSSIDWAYPFVESKLFVLTLSAGLEGYHISVDGKHVTSFPYRTGFVLEDATGFSVNGDIDVHTVVAVALPTSHSSFSPQRLLDMSDDWKAPPLPKGPADLFIGILSAGNHFAERMAVRKTWMQSKHIRSSNVVARFFVALNGRKEVNTQLKKEADFYGDMIIVPFMDNYELVVLKTVAICEYGIHNLSAKYIMKCDDDNFVRVDVVLKEVERLSHKENVYIGNLNYYHKPLRVGKWAVTYEEWPEEDYPPYANGPGYIISSDIAKYIVSQYDNKILRLFKMEDVSMGMWVEQYNASSPVHYSHNWKFCQFGCIDDYITAHYQSPRQMFCMWDKLSKGKAQCCNMRR